GSGGNWLTSREYITYNYLGASQTGQNSGRPFTGHIASGQSFFVEKMDDTPASEPITFANAMRGSDNNAFFRRAPIPRLWMTVKDVTNNYNETLLGFVADA